ncbi:hypothetical protein HPB50_016131 [Hyalomma asiaticum]|uniref:Uncharacterized protein n=1 Tax=Hyalomma asiaticum TaxID=266040 RepID=A0ACB7TLK5_HYAAI|nr:hypothetical protein HPB50_016131 [Hyalomma asiaticum]
MATSATGQHLVPGAAGRDPEVRTWTCARDEHQKSAVSICNWMGHFEAIPNVAQRLARMGQCFSSSKQSVRVQPCYVQVDPNIVGGVHPNSKKPYIFSDGVGMMSVQLAEEAMGDDSDARAQTTAESSRQANALDESNRPTLVQGSPTEHNSDRQGQVTEDASGQTKSVEDSIDQELTSANHSPSAGVSQPFVFWNHIPSPTLCFSPLLPYDYYSRVPPPVSLPPPVPTALPVRPSPNGVFPALWNGTHCGIWPAPAPQVAVGVLPTPPQEVDNSPKHYICSGFTESHDATPMEILPSARPIPPSTTTSTEGETPAPSEKAENTTGETCEVSSRHSMKPSGPQNGASVTRALKPVKDLHADDPRLAESSVLSLLKSLQTPPGCGGETRPPSVPAR